MTISTGMQSVLLAKEQSTYGTAETTGLAQIPHTAQSFNVIKNATEHLHLRGDRESEDFSFPFSGTEAEITFDFSKCNIHGELLVAALCADDNYVSSSTTDSATTHTISKARRRFTFERLFNHAQVNKDCQVFKDMQVNTYALTVPASGFVTATVGLVGSGISTSDTPTSSAVASDYFHTPFNSGDVTVAIGSSEDDTSPTTQTACTDLTLTIDNGMSPLYTIGSGTPREGVLGKGLVTGSMTLHFEDGDLYQKYLDEDKHSLKVTIGSGDDGVSFYMPRVVFTNVTLDNSLELTTIAVEFTATAHHTAAGAVEKSALTVDFDLNS